MNPDNLIEIRPGVRSGKPCFKDTRITVCDVLEYMAGGMSRRAVPKANTAVRSTEVA